MKVEFSEVITMMIARREMFKSAQSERAKSGDYLGAYKNQAAAEEVHDCICMLEHTFTSRRRKNGTRA